MTVVPLGKDHKIEAIMLSLLNELRVLTVDKGWRWYERRLGPETAHEFCASIEPSIPDSEFEQKPDPSPDEGVSPDRTLVAMRGKPASLTSTAAVPQVSKRDDATVDPAQLLQATREEDNDERSVMKLLEEGGIDLEYKDETGRTALSLAAEKGKGKVVRRLIELGAVINSKDQTGRTPLPWAAAKGHLEIVRHLLEAESYKAFDRAFREASGNAGSHDVVEVGSPGDADLQVLRSKLNTALY
ncbi:hypothetical protein Brms1b_005767 [Colletotrichum noveboracense]|nr:hypothetical protein Brms1b_005767 [Colletotrichum noveboracense]